MSSVSATGRADQPRARPRGAFTVTWMHAEPLRTAADLAITYLDEIDEAPVFPTVSPEDLRAAIDGPLPTGPTDPSDVLTELARDVTPGLVRSQGGRYFGFVTGGAQPVAVGADWLAAAWDQNAFSYVSSPAMSVVEDVTERWLLELLELPAGARAGFVTGCQMAHVTALAAARHRVLTDVGWNVTAEGLFGAPPIAVVTGDRRHSTVDRALRLLGLGTGALRLVETDDRGRVVPEALAATLEGIDGPAIVVAQAGEVNTGSFDPFDAIADIVGPTGAWLHVDGAFGIWARVVPDLRPLTAGIERADSWAFDAHKWLNVPYDSGIAVVRDSEALQAAVGYSGSYLLASPDRRDAADTTPDASRRARGLAVYATIRAFGRDGIAQRVEHCCVLAGELAGRLRELGLTVVNEVEINQVLVRAEDDERTRRVLRAVQQSGEAWMSGTTWQDRSAIRISISSWATSRDDIDRTVHAFASALGDPTVATT